ncbi:MAG: pirin [Siphonobacter sp.]
MSRHLTTNNLLAARIYLSGSRGCSLLDWFRSYHVFNFGNYQEESRKPFGRLQVLNDDTLAATKCIRMQVEEPTEVLILPIAGGVEYRNSKGEHIFLGAGEYLSFSGNHLNYEITNPYNEELVNYLQIWVKQQEQADSLQVGELSLSRINELTEFHHSTDCSMWIGKFDGRVKGELPLQNLDNEFFVYVIEGAFEVEDRLLESRDGLSLKNTKSLEFEALSNEAILMIIAL